MLTVKVLEELFLTHMDIKRQLKRIIQMEEVVDPNSVRADNQCKLGEWIYGSGQQFDETEEYKALKKIHAEFHEYAYQALKLYSAGNYADALDYVNTGPFEEKSQEIKTVLFNMGGATEASEGEM